MTDCLLAFGCAHLATLMMGSGACRVRASRDPCTAYGTSFGGKAALSQASGVGWSVGGWDAVLQGLGLECVEERLHSPGAGGS